MKGILLIIICMLTVGTRQSDEFLTQRNEMVDIQLEKRGITNQKVLRAMRKVPRHRFVPSQVKERAYYDGALPIGYGQTISQPFIVAYMTQMIKPQPEFKVLEIGTGSGYQAAVLAEIVKEVYSIEIIEELGQISKKRLETLGYKNIKTKVADGYYGWEEHAPFDAILVTAASESIPPPLIQQLKDGGIMAIPVGSPFLTQYLLLVKKKGDKITTKNEFPVRFVPFTRSQVDND